MRGISEETIDTIISSISKHKNGPIIVEFTLRLLKGCVKDLNPWQPIDENTPKDRLIWGFVDGHKRLIIWAKTSHVPLYGFCLADQGVEDFDICNPTHWMELPENPK